MSEKESFERRADRIYEAREGGELLRIVKECVEARGGSTFGEVKVKVI